ncbi:uncharacterized protein LOC142492172 [Ascaphus truei]|uniref:uncharacterized protein LOC142492172 n=1 Tax=Ascaphus truei TaxID=8439 RepID=UPI003F59C18C
MDTAPEQDPEFLFSCCNTANRMHRVEAIFSNTTELFCEDTADLKAHFNRLEKCLLSRQRIWWEITTMENYNRVKRIPRGLRHTKTPSFGFVNGEFEQQWCHILNDCSFKLMDLIIRFKSEENKIVSKQIAELQHKLKAFSHMENFKELDLKTANKLNKQEKTIMLNKQTKFERDKADYEVNQIYIWQKLPSRSKGKPKSKKPYKEGGGNRSILKGNRDNDLTSHAVSFSFSESDFYPSSGDEKAGTSEMTHPNRPASQKSSKNEERQEEAGGKTYSWMPSKRLKT